MRQVLPVSAILSTLTAQHVHKHNAHAIAFAIDEFNKANNVFFLDVSLADLQKVKVDSSDHKRAPHLGVVVQHLRPRILRS